MKPPKNHCRENIVADTPITPKEPTWTCDHKNCSLADGDKDYKHACEVCGAKPTVHPTDLCGPCCFGEAATANGNW